MTKQEYIAKIKESGLGEDVKAKVLNLLENNTLTKDILAQLKEILQADIDKTFDEAGIKTDNNDPEVKKALSELDADLKTVESDLAEDNAFVEKSLADIEAAVGEINGAEDAASADSVRSKLGI